MRKLAVLVGLIVLAVSGPAWAEDDAKTLFSARYDELAAAIEAKDPAAIARVVTPDYAMTDIRGEAHDAQGLMTMGQRLNQAATDRKRTREVMAAAVTGDTAMVRLKVDTSMTRADPDGSVHRMGLVVLSDDAWVRSDGVWRLRTSVQNEVTVQRDGEDVFHQQN